MCWLTELQREFNQPRNGTCFSSCPRPELVQVSCAGPLAGRYCPSTSSVRAARRYPTAAPVPPESGLNSRTRGREEWDVVTWASPTDCLKAPGESQCRGCTYPCSYEPSRWGAEWHCWCSVGWVGEICSPGPVGTPLTQSLFALPSLGVRIWSPVISSTEILVSAQKCSNFKLLSLQFFSHIPTLHMLLMICK